MTTKRALLEAEDQAWRELCGRFDRLGADGWERPGVNGDWAPKDLMAHIACWHAEGQQMLERYFVDGAPPRWVDTEVFNADAYERCRDMTLREVQAMSGAARHRFREEAGRLPDGAPDGVARVVALNGDRHYRDHFDAFDAFLEETG